MQNGNTKGGVTTTIDMNRKHYPRQSCHWAEDSQDCVEDRGDSNIEDTKKRTTADESREDGIKIMITVSHRIYESSKGRKLGMGIPFFFFCWIISLFTDMGMDERVRETGRGK